MRSKDFRKIPKMAASMEPYEKWLTEKLLSLNPDTDTDVFVSYITGILEEDSPEEEKRESLTDFIGQVVEEDQDSVCGEIVSKWKELSGAANNKTESNARLTDHLANILDQQKIETVKTKEKSAEEIARKKAILDSYSAVCDEVDEEELDDPGGEAEAKGDHLVDFKNMNAELVKMHEVEKREKNKAESDKKKEKDRLDRDTQRQKQKDRKESEKKRTQKGERRR